MLPFYAREFDILEVNSTYYGIMPPRTAASMVARTPPGFGFTVKLHETMTHSRRAGPGEWIAFHEMLEPFAGAGRLEGLLAQFPFSFRPSEAAFDHLASTAELASPHPVAVEFRHADWFEADRMERVREVGLSPVSVDLPPLPGLPPSGPVAPGGSFAYVRFHGRNAEHWWEGGSLRYDYSYGRAELSAWLPGLSDLSSRAGRVFLFFNNCHGAQAVDGARMMRSLLEGME